MKSKNKIKHLMKVMFVLGIALLTVIGDGSSLQSQASAATEASVSPTQTNCISSPHKCGYPDETTTGWRHTGVTLTTYGVDLTSEGELNIDVPDTVIDGKDIKGCVNIKADNVTIKRSRVSCASYFPIRVYEGGFKNALIEDVEVDGLNSPDTNAAIGFDNITMRRVDIHNAGEGPHGGINVLMEDSYVHDFYDCDICHTDAFQSDGALNVVLRHNTLINTAIMKNAVVRIATEGSTVKGFTVENNLLSGGNYAVQVAEQGNGFPEGVRLIGNRIVRNWRFAPFDVGQDIVEIEGNYADDTLAPIKDW